MDSINLKLYQLTPIEPDLDIIQNISSILRYTSILHKKFNYLKESYSWFKKRPQYILNSTDRSSKFSNQPIYQS